MLVGQLWFIPLPLRSANAGVCEWCDPPPAQREEKCLDRSGLWLWRNVNVSGLKRILCSRLGRREKGGGCLRMAAKNAEKAESIDDGIKGIFICWSLKCGASPCQGPSPGSAQDGANAGFFPPLFLPLRSRAVGQRGGLPQEMMPSPAPSACLCPPPPRCGVPQRVRAPERLLCSGGVEP